jgi:hypothetical protein
MRRIHGFHLSQAHHHDFIFRIFVQFQPYALVQQILGVTAVKLATERPSGVSDGDLTVHRTMEFELRWTYKKDTITLVLA